jgi:hypothetical protein
LLGAGDGAGEGGGVEGVGAGHGLSFDVLRRVGDSFRPRRGFPHYDSVGVLLTAQLGCIVGT